MRAMIRQEACTWILERVALQKLHVRASNQNRPWLDQAFVSYTFHKNIPKCSPQDVLVRLPRGDELDQSFSFACSPTLCRSLDRKRNYEGIFVRNRDVARHAFKGGLAPRHSHEDWKLSSERVVDLEEDLDFWECVPDSSPDSIDCECNSRLGDPSKSFRKETIHTVEVYPFISVAVTDGSSRVKIPFHSFMPSLNSRMSCEPR